MTPRHSHPYVKRVDKRKKAYVAPAKHRFEPVALDAIADSILRPSESVAFVHRDEEDESPWSFIAEQLSTQGAKTEAKPAPTAPPAGRKKIPVFEMPDPVAEPAVDVAELDTVQATAPEETTDEPAEQPAPSWTTVTGWDSAPALTEPEAAAAVAPAEEPVVAPAWSFDDLLLGAAEPAANIEAPAAVEAEVIEETPVADVQPALEESVADPFQSESETELPTEAAEVIADADDVAPVAEAELTVEAETVIEHPDVELVSEPAEEEFQAAAVEEPELPAAAPSLFGAIPFEHEIVFAPEEEKKPEPQAPAPQVIVVQAPAPVAAPQFQQYQQPAPGYAPEFEMPAPQPQARGKQARQQPAPVQYVEAPYQPAPEPQSPSRPKRKPDNGFEVISETERDPFFTFGSDRRSELPIGRSSRSRKIDAQTETGINHRTWLGEKVMQALEMDASDIHATLNGDRDHLQLRARIDGQMRDFAYLDGEEAYRVMGIFKASAEFASDGSFIPQEAIYGVPVDGEIRKARAVLFRSDDGGDALVMRLPTRGGVRSLEALEFSDKNLALFHKLLRSSNRMLLIAGPMGSGKTTTSHAALMHVSTGERAVWTVEDPVERTLPGLIQLEIDDENGAGFQELLPHLVRADYDTLFLGEIRDKATAAAGVRQAKAGRQVISTIHANDNVTAALRLIELAEDSPLAVMDAVKGIVSQRLVRRLNPAWDGNDPLEKYHGRVPIHEVLTMTDDLIEAVMEQRPLSEIRRVAADASASTFAEDSARLVALGVTDDAEIQKVLGE